jgi:hypothetical protein
VLISLVIKVAMDANDKNQFALTATVPPTTVEFSTEVNDDTNTGLDEDSNQVIDTSPPAPWDAAAAAEGARCVDSLTLSSSCYGKGSNILLSFNVCVPQAGDWVAIYEASEERSNLLGDDAYVWKFTCGNRTCSEGIESGSVSLSTAKLNTQEGTSLLYRAHLMQYAPGPIYEAIASTEEFEVVDNEQNC